MSQPVSPLGFSLKVPEGWARRDTPDGASFADKYGRITVIQTTAPKMPTVDAVKQTLLPDLAKSLHAVTVTAVKPAKLPAGPAWRDRAALAPRSFRPHHGGLWVPLAPRARQERPAPT